MEPTASRPLPASGFVTETDNRENAAVVQVVHSAPYLQQSTGIIPERLSIYSRKIAEQARSHLPGDYRLPDLQTHLDIVCTLAKEQTGDISHLNDESAYSMASGLYYAGINTLEEARRLGLVIVPPGPVFHTWYALHGTTLFNGTNSPKGYDYVRTIEKEADYLRNFEIPVLLVYSTLMMTDEQNQEMSRLFKEHDNIISICLETDFPDHRMVSELEKNKNDRVGGRSDAIRFLTLKHKDEVLDLAARKSRATGKNRIAGYLDKHKGQTLVYSDIDNVIIRPDLSMLTSSGIIACNNPGSSLFIDEWVMEELTPEQRSEAQASNRYLQHIEMNHLHFLDDPADAQKKNDRFHDALFSTYLPKGANKFFKHSQYQYWSTECGHYRLGKANSACLDLQSLSGNYSFRKQAEALNLCEKGDQDKLKALAGMQLLRYLHVNYHRSWNPPTRS